MLKITIELLPGGNKEHKEVIAEGTIWNDMTVLSLMTGNYKARFTDKTKNTFTTEIKGFERSEEPLWKLVWLCLDKYFKEIE